MAALRCAVIGGGIIGVAVARRLSTSLDHATVTVFEKEPRLARHQSGRNSGVVHAGLYYPPGSLKATLCRRGVTLLRELARERGIPFQECGKVVVAIHAGELARLDAIGERAKANGVPGIRMIDAEELRVLEPHAAGIRALHSPHTAIIDYVGVTEALADDVRATGGAILLSQKVLGIKEGGGEVLVTTAGSTRAFDLVIACAGLQSDRVAAMAGEDREPRVVPFSGDYYLLGEPTRGLVNGLIYPVPDPRYPFLGVHLTKRVDGGVMVGPNAFLSLGRERYNGGMPSARDVRDAVGFAGFWRFAGQNVGAAAREARTVVSRRAFAREAAKYVPDLSASDLRPGPRGIRAQAMDARGGLVDDFVITGTGRVCHVRNAPSPGATSSLAIAEHVVEQAIERAGLGSAHRGN
jgi:(S)-2-hydroxyglutarate dehydrogenase